MSDVAITPAKAYFEKKGDSSSRVHVHFNPASLQSTVSNHLQSGNGNGQPASGQATQYVSQTTAKLDMELVFDTTDTGADVRLTTGKLKSFLQPSGGARSAPPVVEFHWGTYAFSGMIESYRETLDFFDREGAPLRATVNLGLVDQDATTIFAGPAGGTPPAARGGGEAALVAAPDGAAGVAAAGGAPDAARAVAAANEMESLRFGGGADLAVSAKVELKPPVAFASGAAGYGAGASLAVSGGVGLSGGASVGTGGFHVGLGAGTSIGPEVEFNASASAGMTATGGAFVGLRASSSRRYQIDVAALRRPAASVALPASGRASFSLGGAADAHASAGLSADVGVASGAGTQLRFDP